MDRWHLTLKSRKSCSMKVRDVAICDQLGQHQQSSQCFDRHQFRWRLLRIKKRKWDLYLMMIPSISITYSKVHCHSLGGVEEEKQRFYLRSHSERILFSIQSLGETPSLNYKYQTLRSQKMQIVIFSFYPLTLAFHSVHQWGRLFLVWI